MLSRGLVPQIGQVCTKRGELAHRARGVDLRRGNTGCCTCGITPDVLAQDAGSKLNLKISVDNLLASAQVFSAAEVALDDIDEFSVEVTVVNRGHEGEHGNEHREVGHHNGSNRDLTLAHRRSLIPPSSPVSRLMP